MYTSISSRRGTFVAALATAALTAMLGVNSASATATTNLVANGDFTANAADFQQGVGYTGVTGNASAITDWTTTVGYAATTDNTGINLLSNGGNGSPAAFQPDNFVFAFMQGTGTGLFQQINGLTVGQAYSVSYLAASRYNNPTITSAQMEQQALTATVTNGSQTDGSLTSTSTNTATGTIMGPGFFQLQLFGFTASATSETLSFMNSSPASFDSAVDISGVVIDPINYAAVPEPASWMLLLSACAGGLLLLSPRRLRRA